MICCCTGGQIIVVTFRRMTIGGGSNTIVALDGTGAVLWYYDTGLTSGGSEYIAGRAIIDASGNVYVAIFGLTTASHSSSRLLKLNKSGVLQWTYDPGDSTSGCGITAASNPTFMISGCAFDSSGNIVFGRFCSSGTAFVYAVKVDTSGNHVADYSTHNMGFGGLADGAVILGGNAGPTTAIALDASDNVYWIEPFARGRLMKVNSSGTFQSSVLPTMSAGTAGTDNTIGTGWALVCDKTNAKLFWSVASTIVGDGSTKYSTNTRLLIKIDAAALTEDWHFTVTNLTGASLNLNSGKTNLSVLDQASTSCNLGIAYDANVLRVFFTTGTISLADGVTCESNFASCQSGATPTVGFINAVDSTLSHKSFGTAICVDTTTDDVFAIVESTSPVGGGTFAGLRKMSATSGVVVWTALSTSGMKPLTVAAGTHT